MPTPTRRLALAAALVSFTATAWGQPELPPETKAIISKLKDEARSKSATTRASAYRSMGELGKDGLSLRRTICNGMLDPSVTVRTAAADALKKVDEPLYKDATAIYIDKDMRRVAAVASKQGEAEALVPVILPMLLQLTPLASQPGLKGSPFSNQLAREDFATCMRTLVAIAPEDEVVNKGVISLLTNPHPDNRTLAVDLVGRVKNRKLALPTIIALVGSLREPEATRARAVLLLPELADENTRPRARKVAESVRLDSSRAVREAAEAALARFGQ